MFDLSHDVKMSLDMGNLVPIMCMEAIPGDRFTISAESLIRLAPMIAPVMHQIDVFTHFFFVPNRILWAGWEDFITGNGDPAFPKINNLNAVVETRAGSLADYLGLPVGVDIPGGSVSALPFAAYQKIYDDYYRDQNLIDEVLSAPTFPGGKLPNGNGNATVRTALSTLRKRAWRHDYFTSALPFAQKGDAVSLPIIGDFPDVEVDAWHGAFPDGTAGLWTANTGGANFSARVVTEADIPAGVENGRLFARTSDLSDSATAVTINDLRTSMRLQEWLERNARGGTRYTESIHAHFGVTNPDSRLQRPEYITGSKNPVVISEVLQNSETDTSPQGNMAGHGIAVTNGNRKSYYVQEHGYVIGIMSILPRSAYQDGIERHWFKDDRLLYAWPTFAHLGEQEIWNKELYFSGNPSVDDATFGYTPRYAEYKYMDSKVRGEFRTNLDYWHMGRKFTSTPALNEQFISADPTKRIFAVESETEHSVYAHVFNRVKVRRKLPKYGTPQF